MRPCDSLPPSSRSRSADTLTRSLTRHLVVRTMGVLAAIALLSPVAAHATSASAGSASWWNRPSDGDYGSWFLQPPTIYTSIEWTVGDNDADGAVPHNPKPIRIEPKFYVPTSGPQGITFAGVTVRDGPGKYGSRANSIGSGFSYIATDGTPVAQWNVLANGTLGTGLAPSWYAYTRANDPMYITYGDIRGDVSGHTDVCLPIEVASFSFGGKGEVRYHVSLLTATGTSELLDMRVQDGAMSATGGDLGVRFYAGSSLSQLPPNPLTDGPGMSVADVKSLIQSNITGGTMAGPIFLSALIEGMPVPSTDMGDGFVARIYEDLSVRDADLDGSFRIPSRISNVVVPEAGSSGVQVIFPPVGPPGPGEPNDNIFVYGLARDASWVLHDIWDWNAGTTRGLPLEPGFDLFEMAPGADMFPIQGQLTYPLPSDFFQPPPPLVTMPDFVLGLPDVGGSVLNPSLGLGGGVPLTINLLPGLSLNSVPRDVGANHWQYIPIQMNFQPDPQRPWLYVGGNPGQGFVQPSWLTLNLDGLFDPNGITINMLPISVILSQPPLHRNFQVTAFYDQDGNVQVPAIDLGAILAQPYQVTFGVTPSGPQPSGLEPASMWTGATVVQPGYFSLVSAAVSTGPAPALGVGDRSAPPTALAFAPPSPNPFSSVTRFAITTPTRDRVRVRVYDLSGRAVRTLADEMMEAGRHDLRWDGRDDSMHPLHSGAYYARVESGGSNVTRMFVLIH